METSVVHWDEKLQAGVFTPKKQESNYKPPTPRRGDRVALIIQGRGLAVGYAADNKASKTRFSPGDCQVGSFDMEQALKNKELGFW